MPDLVYPVYAIIAILLTCATCPPHWRARNIGVLGFAMWPLIANFAYVVDHFLWWDSMEDRAPIWCDIGEPIWSCNQPMASSSMIFTRADAILTNSHQNLCRPPNWTERLEPLHQPAARYHLLRQDRILFSVQTTLGHGDRPLSCRWSPHSYYGYPLLRPAQPLWYHRGTWLRTVRLARGVRHPWRLGASGLTRSRFLWIRW